MNRSILQKSILLNKTFSYISTSNTTLKSYMGFTLTLNKLNFKLKQALAISSNSKIKNFEIVTGSKMIPHQKKVETGGEDSFLVCEDLVMVADGVGGWAGKGVDPGLFSRELRDNLKEEYFKRKEMITDEFEMKNSLIEALKKTKSKGSSTVALLLINQKTKKLHATYVGDSLYMILRYSTDKEVFECYYKSNEQQHKFNQPFQIGTNGDSPNLAIIESHDIFDKDIVIVASDGLWDNLYDDMILEIINDKVKMLDGRLSNVECEVIAEILASLAEKKSKDINYESPFSKRARMKGYQYFGGKEDDITIVVTQVKAISDEDSQSQSLYENGNI